MDSQGTKASSRVHRTLRPDCAAAQDDLSLHLALMWISKLCRGIMYANSEAFKTSLTFKCLIEHLLADFVLFSTTGYMYLFMKTNDENE